MRKISKKLKESLRNLLMKKTEKQLRKYWVLFCIISMLLCCSIVVAIVTPIENEIAKGIILILTEIIYVFFLLVMGVYYAKITALVAFTDNQLKIREIFKDDICLNLIPMSLDVYQKIVNILKTQGYKQFCQDSNFEEYKKTVDKLIENNELALTAQLVEDVVIVSICYEGKNYQGFKCNNFEFFVSNFSIVK